MRRDPDHYDEHGRYAGAETQRLGAKRLKISSKRRTYDSIDDIQHPFTLIQITAHMNEAYAAKGLSFNQDVVSGHLNTFTKEAKLVIVGHTKNPETSLGKGGKKAQLFAYPTDREYHFVKNFVRAVESWASGDTILTRLHKDPALWAEIKDRTDGRTRRMMDRWPLSMIWKRKYKDNGIRWLMENYHDDGTRR